MVNPWRGENKHFTVNIVPSTNGKTSRITMGYDVDFGWDLYGRYTGMYLDGNPGHANPVSARRAADHAGDVPERRLLARSRSS